MSKEEKEGIEMQDDLVQVEVLALQRLLVEDDIFVDDLGSIASCACNGSSCASTKCS